MHIKFKLFFSLLIYPILVVAQVPPEKVSPFGQGVDRHELREDILRINREMAFTQFKKMEEIQLNKKHIILKEIKACIDIATNLAELRNCRHQGKEKERQLDIEFREAGQAFIKRDKLDTPEMPDYVPRMPRREMGKN
jgi:hypothetical protein